MPLKLPAAVLHVNTSSATSNSPTMRIARFAAEEMGLPLIHDVASAKAAAKQPVEVLFIKHGMIKFSEHRDYAMALYAQAGTVINLENDYAFAPDPRFRKLNDDKTLETWGTVKWPKELLSDPASRRYVNWNVLTWMPPDAWAKPQQWPTPVFKGILYYGAHRADRVKYFKKYLRTTKYPVMVSTFKGREAFMRSCGLEQNQVMGPFRNTAEIACWPMTIYIEDTTSHRLFTSPANRFYECLQLGVAQAIDAKAYKTLVDAGFTVKMSHVVDSQKDVKRLLKEWDSVRCEQRRLWHRNFTTQLRSQLRAACRHAFGAQCGM